MSSTITETAVPVPHEAHSRDLRLDLMRLLGLLLIMIAHANPPAWLFQLRNFGTPLLIVASALTYSTIYHGRPMNFRRFFKRRISRLVIPPWVFLSFFFVFWLIAYSLAQQPYPYSWDIIVSSFLFSGGIGFLWIFKLYIFLALMTPLALVARSAKLSNARYFLMLAGAWLAFEFGVRPLLHDAAPELDVRPWNDALALIPYGLLFLYGVRLDLLSIARVKLISAASLFAFLVIAMLLYREHGRFMPTQAYKYPPGAYFLAYSFFALNLVYVLCMRVSGFSKRPASGVTWLSSNSLWVYLWHIFALILWREASLDRLDPGLLAFTAKAVFLFGFGIVATLVQMRVVRHLMNSMGSAARRALVHLT